MNETKMHNRMHERQEMAAFRDLYPSLGEQELKRAAANFSRYVEIAWEVHEERDLADSVDSSLTAPMIKERSNCSLKN
jgi:hypothetical protein